MSNQPKEPLKKLIDVIRSWKGLTIKEKPAKPNFDQYKSWHQTEEEYQKEQQEWLNHVKRKKQEKSKE